MALFLDVFLPPFTRHLRYARFFKCLPIEWNEKQKKIIINHTFSGQIFIRIWAFVNAGYIGFQILNITLREHIFTDKLVATLIVVVYLICFGIGFEFELDTAPIENLNTCFQNKG